MNIAYNIRTKLFKMFRRKEILNHIIEFINFEDFLNKINSTTND